jgi:hypothetical protein
VARKSLIALVTVGVLVSIFAVCLVSAIQLLEPREMPFGVTGPSPVVSAVQIRITMKPPSWDTVAHWETSGSRELILRSTNAPHGALVEV